MKGNEKMKKGILLIVVMVVSVGILYLVPGCEGEAGKGAGIGSLAGAGIGAIAGHQSGRTAEGALIGGAVGGTAGYMIGAEKDRKKTEVQTQTAIQEANTFYVNITNSNGSVTPVRIIKQGNAYVGPRGEQYPKLPTAEELKPIYGF